MELHEVSGISDPCGHCYIFAQGLGAAQDIQQTPGVNGASVPVHESQVQCVQRAWWSPH